MHDDDINTRAAETRDLDDDVVVAVGKTTEALEWVERARGRLFDFHQLLGHGDSMFSDAVDALRAAGHHELADRVEREVVGRNVLYGRWTFQVIEEFNETYYEPVRAVEKAVREALTRGHAHVFEARTKEQRRTRGMPGHEAEPQS